MAQWASAHGVSERRFVRTFAPQQHVSTTQSGFGEQLGLYIVGVGVPFGITLFRVGRVFYLRRHRLSLFGFLVFWFESIFLGLGGQPYSCLVFLWRAKEFLGVNTLNYEYFMVN
jgi:hypothetical protein